MTFGVLNNRLGLEGVDAMVVDRFETMGGNRCWA
jgi:hypothetical protein